MKNYNYNDDYYFFIVFIQNSFKIRHIYCLQATFKKINIIQTLQANNNIVVYLLKIIKHDFIKTKHLYAARIGCSKKSLLIDPDKSFNLVFF